MQELLAADSRPVPVALRDTAAVPQGAATVPKVRYTSPAFAELEHDHVWRRSWQLACREEELAKPGSHVVYDVAGESLLVARGADGIIRAFHNACLHRGTRLRTEDGRVGSFRCPFHGWTWTIDGDLADVPCAWDFPQVVGDPEAHRLPQVRVAVWKGFVMVNLDPACEPFETYAAKLIEHFESFDLERRYIAFHAVKEVAANWKVVMEAFAEGYHVIATHPQILEFAADANSEYSIWPESATVSRFVNAFGSPSPHLADVPSAQQVVDAHVAFSSRYRAPAPQLGDGESARTVLADQLRAAFGAAYGTDLSDRSDAEMLDAILYHLLPAFSPWAGIGQPLVYRWRPGPTPETCFMDVYRLAPWPDDGPVPPPSPVIELSLEQSWSEATGMGGLAAVFEQDMSNLHRVQAGMHSTGRPDVIFGNYQEARLKMFHRWIDARIVEGLERDGDDPRRVAPFVVPAG